MRRRRRPFVRTLMVGSALAMASCTLSETITNPAPPEADATSEDVADPPAVSVNPAFDEDDAAGPAESDAGN